MIRVGVLGFDTVSLKKLIIKVFADISHEAHSETIIVFYISDLDKCTSMSLL